MNCITWALIGMTGYSLTALLMKFAIRGGQFSSFLLLACATVVVCSAAWITVLLRGDLSRVNARDFVSSSAWLSYATGIALAVAVMSLFRALSLGPTSVVVPVLWNVPRRWGDPRDFVFSRNR
jgi:transporter family protein